MTYVPVTLNTEVPTDMLEKILLGAAADIGWGATVKDNYQPQYRLGSLHREEEYRSSEVKLQGSFLPLATVSFDKGKRTNGRVGIYYGLGFGFATQREVEKYLEAVSHRIEAASRPQESFKVQVGTT